MSEALKASSDPTLTLALIDYRLDTGDDGIRLGRILRRRRGIPFILFSGYMDLALAVTTIKAGGLDAIQKPLTEDRLCDALQAALLTDARPRVGLLDAFGRTAGETDNDRRPASREWARLLLKTCSENDDPYKLQLWTRALCLSESSLRDICNICGVGVRDSRDMARVLRAIHRTLKTGTRLDDHFAIRRDCTLRILFERSGLSRRARTVNLAEFFMRQAFIPTTKPCLRELAHLAANSELFY